ncbi:tape measure protein [Yersinia enterocolitica]|nr:tape measure protein [Yersinia enterocolitica]ELX2217412.1 tape measure protein [Yersinia enterocolitica]
MTSEKQLGNIVYQVEMEVGKLIAAQNKVNERLDQMQGGFDKTTTSSGRLESGLNKVGIAIAGAFTLSAAKKLIDIADNMNMLDARVKRLSSSVEEAKATMASLSTIASNTGSSLSSTQKLWETLTSSLKEAGATNGQVLLLTDTLQKIGTVGGSSTEEMSNALRQFGQSIAGGVVRAEEFNSVLENMPELARQIAAGLGVSLGDLRKMMLDGKLTAEQALNAIQNRAQSVNIEFDKMPVTVDRAKNSLDVAFKNMISDLNQSIGLTQTLAGLMMSVSNNLSYYNKNIGDSSRMPKLIELQKKYNDELAEGKQWYETDTVFQQRRGQAAFELKRVEGEIANIRAKSAKDAAIANQPIKVKSNAQSGDDKQDKLLKNSQRRIELTKLEGEARARLQAQYDAEDAGMAKDDPRTKDLENQYAQIYKNSQATKEGNKVSNDAENALKTQRESIAELSTGYEEGSLALAKFKAIQALGDKSSPQDTTAAEKNAEIQWKLEQEKQDKISAKEMQTSANIAKVRDEDLAQAKRQLDAKFIDEETYQKRRLEIAGEYSKKIAEESANNAVTPQQQNAALVDPVQALANENAQKLALIQKFEEDKTLTEQQALSLRNAANTQYEQARLAAQWDIWRNQSQSNQYLASSIDALGQRTTNMLTGLLTGTQSAEEAMKNLAATIIQEGVNALVQMGMQQVKNMIMGQAAATTALAATAAQATAAAAAWAPAAVSASIATMGGASTVGTTAYGTALAASKGLALAGARKNGGPVNADSMYQVGEGGEPELLKASNGKQYMIPGDNGKVISNKDMQGGSGGAGTVVQQEVNFHITTTNGIDDATMQKMAAMMKTVSLNTIKDQQRPNGLLRK